MYCLFYGCSSLRTLNLSNFDTSQVRSMEAMFHRCSSLNFLDLSNFNTSHVENMCEMFYECYSLNSLEISNFDTSRVTDMNNMFYNCKNLYYLDISNFNTSKVKYMHRMFEYCSSLISLDLSNFDTSQVKDMNRMFEYCSNLHTLNLSNFDTSQVTDMTKIFCECSLLNSLDISNFKTSQVTNINRMFSKCSSLTSLDLQNLDTSKVTDMNNMFYYCKNLNYLDLSNFNTSKVKYMNNMFHRCEKLISLNLSNFNTEKVINVYKMFYKCKMLEYINFKLFSINSNVNTDNIFEGTPHNLLICSEKDNEIFQSFFLYKRIIYCDNANRNKYYCYMNDSIEYNKYICDICQNDFLFKYNESNGNDSYINCFEPKETINTIEIQSDYHLCYYSCKTCEIEGNETYNNCIECEDDFIYEFNITNSKFKNCYKNISFDIINNFNTSEFTSTDIDYQDYTNETINSIIIEENNQNKNSNETAYNNLIDGFYINEINSKIISQISDKNRISLLTTANNEDKNNITIDLGECEDILKNEYNISKSNSLYILELILEEQGMKIPKVEYEVYYPFNNSNYLTKLNINLCEGTKIKISIPVKLNGTLDIHNPKSGYYNAICYIVTSDCGTDISLKDRRNEFVNNNLTLCEENCDLIGYDYEKEKAKCSCDIKTFIPEIKDIKFNKKEFFKSFKDINNIVNLKVMKCYKVVFKINGLKKNYGFFIMVSIIIFYFISLLIFVTFSNTQLKKEIIKIIYALKFSSTPIKKEKQKDMTKDKPVIVKKRKKKKKKKLIYKTSNMKNKVNIIEKKIEFYFINVV